MLKKESENLLQEIQSYLFPKGHPLAAALEELFSTPLLTSGIQDLESKGFLRVSVGQFSGRFLPMIHPDFPGFFFKIPSDTSSGGSMTLKWLDRIRGAAYIRKILENTSCKYLKVPRKWLFSLPGDSRTYILVAEKMDLLSRSDNLLHYRFHMKEEVLEELANLIAHGLNNIRPDNLFFCKDGTLAFVDTEGYLRGGFQSRFHRIDPYLNREMYGKWQQLVARQRLEKGIFSELIEEERQLYMVASPIFDRESHQEAVVSYAGQQILNLSQARKYVVESVQLLVDRLNELVIIEGSGSYLPFTYQNLQMDLTFYDSDAKFRRDGFISMVALVKGVLYYHFFDPAANGWKLHFSENYEEAGKILRGEAHGRL